MNRCSPPPPPRRLAEAATSKQKAKQEWLKQFVINFGTDDGGETTTFNGTIPQTLMMFNGT